MSILKEDLIRHLFWKKISPTSSDYYKETQIAIYEFLKIDPEVDTISENVKARVALEAMTFTKKVKKNWPTTNRTENQFVQKYNRPGGFLRNYVTVPGPYKREAVVPPKKKSIKRKSRRRPSKPWAERPKRTRTRQSAKVKEAAKGDFETVLNTAANMARKEDKALSSLLKKLSIDPSLASNLLGELKKNERRQKRGLGKQHTFCILFSCVYSK